MTPDLPFFVEVGLRPTSDDYPAVFRHIMHETVCCIKFLVLPRVDKKEESVVLRIAVT